MKTNSTWKWIWVALDICWLAAKLLFVSLMSVHLDASVYRNNRVVAR